MEHSDRISPSKFMRELRPECYSDTEDQVAYLLDVLTLEYHLDSVTQRNQGGACGGRCLTLHRLQGQ